MEEQQVAYVNWNRMAHTGLFIQMVTAEEYMQFKSDCEKHGQLYVAEVRITAEKGGRVEVLAVSDQPILPDRVFEETRAWMVQQGYATMPESAKPQNRFQGELMQCCVCSKKQQSDPDVESNWTYIQMDEQGFYVCPLCLQDSPQARKGNYATVYAKVLRRMARLVARERANTYRNN